MLARDFQSSAVRPNNTNLSTVLTVINYVGCLQIRVHTVMFTATVVLF